MAGEFSFSAWSALVTSQAITDTNSHTSGAVSQEGKLGTEVSVECAYGATVDQGALIYIARQVDGTPTYEALTDNPWGFEMASAVSATRRVVFSVPPDIGDFQVIIQNDTGASITVDVSTRQITLST